MNLLRAFMRPAPPSIEDSARHLSEWRCLTERERFKTRARIMRQEMGLPPLSALERGR